MKTRIIALFTIATLFFVACSKDSPESFFYKSDVFVSFENITSSSVAISEDQGEGRISILISNAQPTDVTINVTIEEIEVNVGYSIPNTQVTIPAGELKADLIIIPVDDDLNTPSTRLRATITSTSPDFKIGLREVGSYIKNITIVNDDCPTKFNTWFGALNVVDVGFGTIAGIGSGNDAGECDILRIVSATNFVAWTGGAEQAIEHDFTLIPDFPNATTGLVTLSPTRIGQTNFNFPSAPATPGEVLYTITYGEYDETTKIIEVDYQIRARQLSTGTIFSLGAAWSGTNRFIKP